MPRKSNTPTPYPYDILPLPELDPEALKKLDRRDVSEVLRIEALLRSPLVWDLHHQATWRTRKKNTAPPIMNHGLWISLLGENRLKLIGAADAPMRRLLWDESLRDRFSVDDGWAVLLGSHHRYVQPQSIPFLIGNGIVDLSTLHQSRDLSFNLKYLEEKQSRYLYLMIDSAEVSPSDLMALKDLLSERKRAVVDTGLHKPPSIMDLRAWRDYFRCYDILKREGASFDDIGQRVYHPATNLPAKADITRQSSKREAKRACKNVEDLIKSAEEGSRSVSRP